MSEIAMAIKNKNIPNLNWDSLRLGQDTSPNLQGSTTANNRRTNYLHFSPAGLTWFICKDCSQPSNASTVKAKNANTAPKNLTRTHQSFRPAPSYHKKTFKELSIHPQESFRGLTTSMLPTYPYHPQPPH
jgi:hypothetical protein